MSGPRLQVSLEPAFLLHHYAWRDSSRILELMTPNHGRVGVFARASRRQRSGLPAALQPFGALLVSWSGRGEAGRLTGAEAARPPLRLKGQRLMSGFYANELIMKLLPRNDPHPALYSAYTELLTMLSDETKEPARPLRLFEKRLLENLGWGLRLDCDCSNGQPLDVQRTYRYHLDSGPEEVHGVAEGSLIFSGASLLSLAGEELDDPRSLADARRLLRAALDLCLDGRSLRTREVLVAMRAHGAGAPGG